MGKLARFIDLRQFSRFFAGRSDGDEALAAMAEESATSWQSASEKYTLARPARRFDDKTDINRR